MFTLKIEYTTGNSFGSERVSTEFGCWVDVNLALRATKDIIEHYKLVQEMDSYSFQRSRTDEEVMEDMRSKDWEKLLPEDKDIYYYKGGPCRVVVDDGSRISVPTSIWCGYFETLHEVSVKLDSDEFNLEV